MHARRAVARRYFGLLRVAGFSWPWFMGSAVQHPGRTERAETASRCDLGARYYLRPDPISLTKPGHACSSPNVAFQIDYLWHILLIRRGPYLRGKGSGSFHTRQAMPAGRERLRKGLARVKRRPLPYYDLPPSWAWSERSVARRSRSELFPALSLFGIPSASADQRVSLLTLTLSKPPRGLTIPTLCVSG